MPYVGEQLHSGTKLIKGLLSGPKCIKKFAQWDQIHKNIFTKGTFLIWSHCAIAHQQKTLLMNLVPLCNKKNKKFYKRHFFNLVPQCNCTPTKDTSYEFGPTVQ